MSHGRALCAALLALLAVACSRRAHDSEGGGAHDASAGASIDAASTSLWGDAAPLAETRQATRDAGRVASLDADAASVAEALRARVMRPDKDPGLAPHAQLLRAHFGGLPPFDVQTAHIGEDRAALLVARASGDPAPFVFLEDAAHHVLWQKDHPVGGIVPPVADVAIASGPSGRVAIAACDAPTETVALRQWNEDASPFADFRVLEVDGCAAVSLLRWPSHGWLVVAWRVGSARAGLLGERGTLTWGDAGLDLGAATRSGAPGAAALDTDDSFVIVERAPLPGGQTAYGVDHVLAFRYDKNGTSLWPGPVDLGQAPRPGDGGAALPRPTLVRSRAHDGELEVALDGTTVVGAAEAHGDAHGIVGLRSNGEVRGAFGARTP